MFGPVLCVCVCVCVCVKRGPSIQFWYCCDLSNGHKPNGCFSGALSSGLYFKTHTHTLTSFPLLFRLSNVRAISLKCFLYFITIQEMTHHPSCPSLPEVATHWCCDVASQALSGMFTYKQISNSLPPLPPRQPRNNL